MLDMQSNIERSQSDIAARRAETLQKLRLWSTVEMDGEFQWKADPAISSESRQIRMRYNRNLGTWGLDSDHHSRSSVVTVSNMERSSAFEELIAGTGSYGAAAPEECEDSDDTASPPPLAPFSRRKLAHASRAATLDFKAPKPKVLSSLALDGTWTFVSPAAEWEGAAEFRQRRLYNRVVGRSIGNGEDFYPDEATKEMARPSGPSDSSDVKPLPPFRQAMQQKQQQPAMEKRASLGASNKDQPPAFERMGLSPPLDNIDSDVFSMSNFMSGLAASH
eukprot:CAMPEP_0206238786 /NCGR_PEP_ID=MMETSP0047_2-20121206/15009_1 /ASSEMBLY_ACC=CAM_ASM_000192 /TAXON_ID=195065 /ORGANISM="Chroomonas mesostigmatica_cf, Strain CCMP1168" /LENGTH=276 /DNA_ID=CAMNT_0053663361 /DNA_START=95 /DNA_END=925 /DNA_ORIENTATION=+